jgi:rhamnose utilization protein RhaD (predicted bifunctional aldolase and dehydrogenase)
LTYALLGLDVHSPNVDQRQVFITGAGELTMFQITAATKRLMSSGSKKPDMVIRTKLREISTSMENSDFIEAYWLRSGYQRVDTKKRNAP